MESQSTLQVQQCSTHSLPSPSHPTAKSTWWCSLHTIEADDAPQPVGIILQCSCIASINVLHLQIESFWIMTSNFWYERLKHHQSQTVTVRYCEYQTTTVTTDSRLRYRVVLLQHYIDHYDHWSNCCQETRRSKYEVSWSSIIVAIFILDFRRYSLLNVSWFVDTKRLESPLEPNKA